VIGRTQYGHFIFIKIFGYIDNYMHPKFCIFSATNHIYWSISNRFYDIVFAVMLGPLHLKLILRHCVCGNARPDTVIYLFPVIIIPYYLNSSSLLSSTCSIFADSFLNMGGSENMFLHVNGKLCVSRSSWVIEQNLTPAPSLTF